MARLSALCVKGLSIRTVLRTSTFLSERGEVLGTLSVSRSPIGRLTDPAFRKRLVRLEIDTPELDTVLGLEVLGTRVADVVHVFPHNVPFAQGGPAGRGLELRDPDGKVLAYADPKRRGFETVFEVRDAEGALTVRVTASGFKSHLSFERASGGALMDLSRRPKRPDMRDATWLADGLGDDDCEALAEALVLALLW